MSIRSRLPRLFRSEGWGLNSRPAGRRSRPGFEPLEDRLTPASFVEVGAALNLDLNVAGESVRIVSEGTDYTLTLSGGNTWSGIDGADVSGNGTDTLTVTSSGLLAFASVNLTDSASGASVTFADSGPNVYGQSFNVTLDSGPGAVTFDGASSFGAGSLKVTTSANVVVNSGAVVQTGTGDLNLSANQQSTASTGNFVGIDVAGTLQVTDSGALTLLGKGGTNTGGSQIGILIRGGGLVSGGTGPVSITGVGGVNSGPSNIGVLVTDAGSAITSAGGSVAVTGTGGALVPQVQRSNPGVVVSAGGRITAGDLGDVTVTGTGAPGDNPVAPSFANYGVYVTGEGSAITSGGGNVKVTGTGGYSLTTDCRNNYGVFVTASGRITSSGAGSVTVIGSALASKYESLLGVGVTVSGAGQITSGGSGGVTVTGTGGMSGSGYSYYNYGVYVTGAGSAISSGGGDVRITGTGGKLGSRGLIQTYGVFTELSGRITSGGAGSVTVIGQGGSGGGSSTVYCHGVYATTGGRITSGGAGAVTVTGTGGEMSASLTSFSYGISLQGDAQITSGGGPVTVTGTGSVNMSYSFGVAIQGSGAMVTSGGGDVTVTGYGRGIHDYNIGMYVADSGQITSGGAGNVSVTGSSDNFPTGIFNEGIEIRGGRISSGGTGSVTISGTGSYLGLYSNGVFNWGTITSGGGNVEVTGTGGGSGVGVYNHGLITATGTGTVSVIGQGGRAPEGAQDVIGIVVEGQILSGGGDVLVSGTSGTCFGGLDHGVRVYGGLISSGGDGAVTVVGYSGFDHHAGDSFGVKVDGGGITSGGAGTVTVTGISRNMYSTNHDSGVGVSSRGQITSGGGNVVVTGRGGGTGYHGHGVVVDGASRITSGGAGTVTVTGIAGVSNQLDTYGVLVSDANSLITSGGVGLVTINATTGITTTPAGVGRGLVVLNSGGIMAGTGGDLILSADDMLFDATAAVSAGAADSVTLRNYTAALPIELGSAGVFGGNLALKLPDAVLDRVTAGTLVIGRDDAVASGPLVISGDMTRSSAVNVELVSLPGVSTTLAGPLVDLAGGTLGFGSGTGVGFKLTSPVLNVGYNQLRVNGTVDLAGAKLLLAGTAFPVTDTTFTLVAATSVANTFDGLPDGGSKIFNNRSYVAGYGAATMTLTFINHAPTPVDDTSSTSDQAAVVILPLANDTDPDLGDALAIVSVSTPSVGSVQFTSNSITYTPVVNFNGPVTFTYTVVDLGGLTATAKVTVTVTDITPPKVVDLKVLYGSRTYSILNSTRTLPFFNIKGIEVDFSEPVTLASSAVSLTGRNVPLYNPSLSVASDRAVLSLPSAIDIDRLLLTLDGQSSFGVHDLVGNAMGSNLSKGFNVLPGDFNGDGVVTTTDLVGVGVLIGLPPTGSSVFADLDGDGAITLADYNLVKTRIGRKLPTA